jgi:pilus assembly protein Flp/PilA
LYGAGWGRKALDRRCFFSESFKTKVAKHPPRSCDAFRNPSRENDLDKLSVLLGRLQNDMRKSEMKNSLLIVKSLLNEESGQDLIEYALVAALIALGAIAAMGSLSNKVSNEFNRVGNSL